MVVAQGEGVEPSSAMSLTSSPRFSMIWALPWSTKYLDVNDMPIFALLLPSEGDLQARSQLARDLCPFFHGSDLEDGPMPQLG